MNAALVALRAGETCELVVVAGTAGSSPRGEMCIRDSVKMLDPKYNPEHFEDARFLGRGTCTVSQIFYTSPSRCAVADSCACLLYTSTSTV